MGKTAATMVREPVRWALEQGLPIVAVRRAARAGDLHAQMIVDRSRPDNPYPALDRLRDRGPLVTGRLALASATHAVCREVLTSEDTSLASTVDALSGLLGTVGRWARSGAALGPLDPPSLLAVDPPVHTRYRRLVSSVFTPRAVEGLRTTVTEVASGLLDAMAARSGPVDLVESYASLRPVTVIAEILGVPPQDRAHVLELGHASAASLDVGLGWRQHRRVQAALRGFDTYLGRHLERLRREPGPDLLSRLVHAGNDAEQLSERELRATAGLLLAAGFETTVNLLGNGVDLLLRHPDQRERLLDGEATWANATEEVLRFESPVQVTGRGVVRDTEIAGRPVRRGTFIATLLAGANRDPEVFTDPHTFDVGRTNAREHLAFSAGRHFCLGAALARLEGEIGLGLLHERFPGLSRAGEVTRRPTRVLRGWSHLPVRLAAWPARRSGPLALPARGRTTGLPG